MTELWNDEFKKELCKAALKKLSNIYGYKLGYFDFQKVKTLKSAYFELRFFFRDKLFSLNIASINFTGLPREDFDKQVFFGFKGHKIGKEDRVMVRIAYCINEKMKEILRGK